MNTSFDSSNYILGSLAKSKNISTQSPLQNMDASMAKSLDIARNEVHNTIKCEFSISLVNLYNF